MHISTHNKGIYSVLSEFYLVKISDYAPLIDHIYMCHICAEIL